MKTSNSLLNCMEFRTKLVPISISPHFLVSTYTYAKLVLSYANQVENVARFHGHLSFTKKIIWHGFTNCFSIAT